MSFTVAGCHAVLNEVWLERVQQEERYGDVNDKLLDGTGPEGVWLRPVSTLRSEQIQKEFRQDYEEHEALAANRLPTWMHLVREEVAEAFQESDPERLAEELIQVAALCVSWVERIRAR